MIVPWQDVSEDTLNNLLEEFVTRDGTDYGEREVPMTTRVAQVREALRHGELVIWFDSTTETIDILSRDRVREIAARPDVADND